MSDSAFPILSRRERDRRFAITRQFLEAQDLDALVIGQTGSRVFQYFTASQQYLSNEPNGQGAVVVFPRASDPVLLTMRTQWGQIWADAQEGVAPWIKDYRLAEGDQNVVSVLRERGLDIGRLGLVLPGSGAGAYGQVRTGALADPMWSWINAELPGLEGVDAVLPYSLVSMPKSEEEQAVARRLGAISDEALSAFVDAAKIGASEIDLHAAAMGVFVRAGVDCGNVMIVPGHLPAGMGLPRFLLPNRPPRPFRPGDVLMTETFPVLAGIEAQLSLAVHIGEPTKDALIAHKACQDAHAAAMNALSPGVTFHQVWEAMYEAVAGAGCWNWTPLIHSLSPMCWLGQQHHGLAARSDLPPELRLPVWPPAPPPHNHLPIEVGTLFSIEPGAAIGRNRSRTGALALVTPNGAVELTSVGTKLHIKS